MSRPLQILWGIGVLAALLGYSFYSYARPYWVPKLQNMTGKRTIQQVVDRYGPASMERLEPFFTEAKAPLPPSHITFLAIKDENKLELWTEENDQKFFIRAYPIKAASGTTGPKLREGDRQVPEGVYRLEYLNPNSTYHLSMKINYPNAFDRQNAQAEKRSQLGGDIFIHGDAVSIGCLAMGDTAIEELFTLVAKTSPKNVTVIIAPSDPRKHNILPLAEQQPTWVKDLYTEISAAFQPYQIFTSTAATDADPLMEKCH